MVHTEKLIQNPPIFPLRHQLNIIRICEFQVVYAFDNACTFRNPYSCRNNLSKVVYPEILLSSCSKHIPLYKDVLLVLEQGFSKMVGVHSWYANHGLLV